MKLKIIALVLIITLYASTVIGIDIFDKDYFAEKLNNKSNSIYFFNQPFTYLTWQKPTFNYEEHGYYQIKLGESKRFVLFECIDGNIEITNKTIGCVK